MKMTSKWKLPLGVLAAMGAPAKVQILRGAREWWHPGRHGLICLGPKKVLGVFGELHPKVLQQMDVKGPAGCPKLLGT